VSKYSEDDRGLTFAVQVVPRASRNEIAGEQNGALRVRIAAAPVDGAANKELIKFLAKTFNLPKKAVEIVAGYSSKKKIVRIKGAAEITLQQLMSGK
jgi:uncharacterized protein (TIGR00251 family)